MMANQKPIQVYQCPKCGVILNGTYEEAQKHVNMLVDTPLLEGLVLKLKGWYKNDGRYMIVFGKGHVSGKDHGIEQGYWNRHMIPGFLSSKYIRQELREGNIFLFSEKEFVRFRKIFDKECEEYDKGYKENPEYEALFDVEGLIRTTPELEKLIG